jgi:hypothetical protein
MNDEEDLGAPVRGLGDGEIIEWSETAGISIKPLLRNGLCPMLLMILGAAVVGTLAEGSPASMLLIALIYNLVAVSGLLLLSLYVVYAIVQVKRTTYYITPQRLLEVRGRTIRKQIPKADLHGLPADQYIRSVWAQRGARDTYDIYVTDNITGVVIRMTSIGGEVPDIIERWVKKQK